MNDTGRATHALPVGAAPFCNPRMLEAEETMNPRPIPGNGRCSPRVMPAFSLVAAVLGGESFASFGSLVKGRRLANSRNPSDLRDTPMFFAVSVE